MELERELYCITEKEAAQFIGVCYRTMKNMRYAGRGPAYIQSGRSIRYRVVMLEKWQQQQEDMAKLEATAKLEAKQKQDKARAFSKKHPRDKDTKRFIEKK